MFQVYYIFRKSLYSGFKFNLFFDFLSLFILATKHILVDNLLPFPVNLYSLDKNQST